MGKKKQEKQKVQETLAACKQYTPCLAELTPAIGESFLHTQSTISLIKNLTSENLSAVFPPLLDTASKIWDTEIDVSIWITIVCSSNQFL